jgi:hypothetical protein
VFDAHGVSHASEAVCCCSEVVEAAGTGPDIGHAAGFRRGARGPQ